MMNPFSNSSDLPMVIIVGLIVFAWLSFFSVALGSLF